jgi:hypothetical protein
VICQSLGFYKIYLTDGIVSSERRENNNGNNNNNIKKVKVKVSLEQVTKAQRGSGGIGLLFL